MARHTERQQSLVEVVAVREKIRRERGRVCTTRDWLFLTLRPLSQPGRIPARSETRSLQRQHLIRPWIDFGIPVLSSPFHFGH